jgi:hypothetical protein
VGWVGAGFGKSGAESAFPLTVRRHSIKLQLVACKKFIGMDAESGQW